jgi:hypothetical protein
MSFPVTRFCVDGDVGEEVGGGVFAAGLFLAAGTTFGEYPAEAFVVFVLTRFVPGGSPALTVFFDMLDIS